MAREVIAVFVEHSREYNSFLQDNKIDFKSIQQGNKVIFYLNASAEKIEQAKAYAVDMTTGYMWFRFVYTTEQENLLINAAEVMGLSVYGEKQSFFLKRKMIAFKGNEQNLALFAKFLQDSDKFLEDLKR